MFASTKKVLSQEIIDLKNEAYLKNLHEDLLVRELDSVDDLLKMDKKIIFSLILASLGILLTTLKLDHTLWSAVAYAVIFFLSYIGWLSYASNVKFLNYKDKITEVLNEKLHRKDLENKASNVYTESEPPRSV